MGKHLLFSVRRKLLTSVSVGVLMLATAGLAPARAAESGAISVSTGAFLSIEGGAACAFGKQQKFQGMFTIAGAPFPNTGVGVGNGGCGWTGRIGFGQESTNLIPGWVDYWGFFARRSIMRRDKSSASGSYYYAYGYGYNEVNQAEYKEKRTVIDFEVGRNIGVGSNNGKLRLFGGLRYANFKGKSDQTGALNYVYYGYVYPFSPISGQVKNRFRGIGPRIGLMGKMELGPGWGLTATGSASALYGKKQTSVTLTDVFGGVTTARLSNNAWVTNIEGEGGVFFAPFGNSSELTLGIRAEAWFSQSKVPDIVNAGFARVGTGTSLLDRHNWGPFARMKFKL